MRSAISGQAFTNGLTRRNLARGGMALAMALMLAGCEDIALTGFGAAGQDQSESAPMAEPGESVSLVERDVEAPEVFQVTEAGLWDGRPSLGGVWVAYPGDIQPERVIIRNQDNKKFVIGALFKRERISPGPNIQISSEAASALGIVAGKPATLNVTALRRESTPVATASADKPAKTETTADQPPVDATETAALDGDAMDAKPEKPRKKGGLFSFLNPKKPAADSAPITETALGEIATAAIDDAESKEAAAATPAPAPAPAVPAKPAGGLEKPFIQIGIFSVEANADNTATSLKTKGVLPIVKAQESKGKKFWRVLVGPAGNASERAALMKKARELGFADAYFVTN